MHKGKRGKLPVKQEKRVRKAPPALTESDLSKQCCLCGKIEGRDMVMGIKVITCADGKLRCMACLAKTCSSCGILIGEGFMEQRSHEVEGYTLCGTCYKWLKKEGRREIKRSPYGAVIYLYPDGHTGKESEAILGNA